MLLLTAYCGLESPTLSETQCRERLANLAAKFLPNGHTVLDATGRWMSPERGIVDEPTQLVQVFAEPGSDLFRAFYDMAGAFKNEASQDCVIVTKQEVEADFV